MWGRDFSPGLGCLPERLDLERVAEVRMASAEDRPQAAGQVGRDEQWTPALVLSDVHAFVRPAALHAFGVARDHHVPEGHSRGSAPKRHQVRQHPGERGTLYLDDAIEQGDAATPESEAGESETDGARGGGPGVAMNAEHVAIIQSERGDGLRQWPATLPWRIQFDATNPGVRDRVERCARRGRHHHDAPVAAVARALQHWHG